MSDEPFYSPHRKLMPPQPTPGEHLWAIRTQDGHQIDCELRDHGAYSVEVELLRDREFLYSRRWPSRELALVEAGELKARYLRRDGIIISVSEHN